MLVDMKRSSHPTFKIFSATGAGSRLMSYMKAVLQEQTRKSTIVRRIEALSRQEPSMQQVVNFDAELCEVGDISIVKSFWSSFIASLDLCIASIAKRVLQVAGSVLSGDQSVTFVNCVPAGMQQEAGHVEVLLGLKFKHETPHCVQSEILSVIRLLTSAPLELLLPGFENTDIARLEELAELLAGIRSYVGDDTAFEPLEKLKALGVDMSSVGGLFSRGTTLLSEQEAKFITPKVEEVMRVLMSDGYSLLGFRGGREHSHPGSGPDANLVWVSRRCRVLALDGRYVGDGISGYALVCFLFHACSPETHR